MLVAKIMLLEHLRNKWTGDMLRKQNQQDLVIDCLGVGTLAIG